MWVKVDDGFTEHQKVFFATQLLGGRHAYGRVVAMAMQGKCYASRALTDGFLPLAVVCKFHDAKPLDVASILVTARLWELVPGGFQIHDYHDYNPTAADVKEKREDDRERQRKHREEKKKARQATMSQRESQRDSVTVSQGLSRVNPERSRARDPVPSRPQVVQERTKAPALTRRDFHSPVENRRATHALLCKLLGEIRQLNRDYTWTDLDDALKTRCAQLQLAYHPVDIRKAIEATDVDERERQHKLREQRRPA